MNQGRDQVKRIWGPGALAVLSCALALMASQPVGGAVMRGAPARMEVAGCGGTIAELGGGLRIEAEQVKKDSERKTFLSSARRLHVLATFEILQRLMAFELRPVERQMAVGVGIWPMELRLFEGVVVGIQRVGLEEGCGISSERAFVMARCLLAPPTA